LRTLEFRIWDKEKQKMYEPWNYPEPVSGRLMEMDMEGLFISIADGSLALLDECGNYEWVDDRRFIKMQFIGLRDKNGKKVYEGDIVRYITMNVYYTGVVFYNEKQARFEIKPLLNHKVRTTFATHGDYGDNLPLSEFDMENTEIIGNIYKNPELVGGQLC